MIKSIRIQNFKSIDDATLHLAPITLVIGGNGAGKTNVFEAVELFRWTVLGQSLNQIFEALETGGLSVRGEVGDFKRVGGDGVVEFSATSNCDTGGGVDSFIFSLRLNVDVLKGVSILKEGIYPAFAPGGDALYFVEIPLDTEVAWVLNQRLYLTDLAARRNSNGADKLVGVAKCIEAGLAGVFPLDPSPERMRGYSRISAARVTTTMEKMAAVLHIRGQQFFSRLTALLRDVVAPDVLKLSTIEGAPGDVTLVMFEKRGKEQIQIPASLLSDGTLRVLGIATALLSVSKGTTLLIEELDSHIHPSRAGVFIRWIHEVAKERGIRVVISSHNPALQDELPYEALPDVTVCYRDAETGATRLQRLGDLDDYVSLVAQGELGELATKRTIERYLPGHADYQAPGDADLSFLAGEPE